MKEKKESWIKRHKILTGILGFFAFLVVVGALSDSDVNSNYSEGELISIESHLILPQDLEIDRIWKVNDPIVISDNATGFIEGVEKKINKAYNFESTRITVKAYRFDSKDNADKFYAQEKEGIDIRGVKEWNLGTDCFGIEKDNLLSGYAKGFCVRNNIVLYIESVSSSYSYASDGKKFMKMMLENM